MLLDVYGVLAMRRVLLDWLLSQRRVLLHVHLQSSLLLGGSFALGLGCDDSRPLLGSRLGSLLSCERSLALLDRSGHVAVGPSV